MKKVLITGATSGFGKLLTEIHLKNNDIVLATGRNLSSRVELSELQGQYPERLFQFDLDVTNKEEVSKCAKEIETRFGSIDILINNAGYGAFGALEEVSEEVLRHQMEVNFFGVVNVTKTFLPLLRKSKGRIFNFSSVFGFMGFPLTSIYCASKFAVEGLTESLRGELAPHGVQVCLIEPGAYQTNFNTKVAWAIPEQNSSYLSQTINYKELNKRLGSQKKYQDPKDVAEGVFKLTRRKKLPMRKTFGMDAALSYILRHYTPWWIYWALLDRFFHFILSKR